MILSRQFLAVLQYLFNTPGWKEALWELPKTQRDDLDQRTNQDHNWRVAR